MADSIRCINELNEAAGRELSADEVQAVYEQIKAKARQIVRGEITEDVDALTGTASIIQKAAELVAQDKVNEAVLKQQRAEMQVQIIAERQSNIVAMKQDGINGVDAIKRLLANTADGKSDQFSLEAKVIGTSSYLKSKIQDTWLSLGNDFLGFLQNKDQIKFLIQEIKGLDTGNALAKKGAEAWLNMAEESRAWFNRLGGDIGKLDDWGFPQHHSQERVARSGKEKWVADIYPLLDQNRYRDINDVPLNEVQIKAILSKAWDTIATNGVNKIEAGQFRGSGARANRHAEERQIHFKDAESTVAYWDLYGEKTFPEILMNHVESMSKDIAFLDHFGPNPENTFRLLRDEAERAEKKASPTKIDKIDSKLVDLDNLFDYMSGKTKPVANRTVANFFSMLRNLNVAGKLGGAVVSSLYGDKVTFEAVSRLNNLPVFKSWYNELRLLNPLNKAERHALQRNGLMLEYMTSAMHRFGEELGSSSFTGKLANGVMRATGMNFVNEMRRGAFGLTMMDALGRTVKQKGFDNLTGDDTRLLSSYGITRADWEIWRLAKLEDYGKGNDHMLTPESIARIPDKALTRYGDPVAVRQNAIVKLLGAVNSESRYAVIEPSAATRAQIFNTFGGYQRGRIGSELMHSIWQFKTFPLAQFSFMMDVTMSRPTFGGKVNFLAGVMLMQAIAGGMILQTQDQLSGKDPRSMAEWKFWVAAWIKGGSLGLYGDFLYSQSGTTRHGSGPLEAAAGPTVGAIVQSGNAMKEAIKKRAEGEESHLGADLLRVGKGFIPGQNIWYTKAATDHVIFQTAQEMLSPGYLARMRESVQRDFGQEYWWEPGEMTPQRPPNFEKVIQPR